MSPPLEVLTVSVKLFAKLLCGLGEGVENPCTYLQAALWSNRIWVCVLGLCDGEPFQD